MNRFFEHNKHYTDSPEVFAKEDPKLRMLKMQKLICQPDLIYELPHTLEGIYTLSGGRQIGKTTLLKQWMNYLLSNKKILPSNIFFMTGELIDDRQTLISLVNDYLKTTNPNQIRIIILDEVNYISGWDLGIKYLADSGALLNVILLLTGSDSTFIADSMKRFPGRGAKADKVNFHLYPLSFYEFIKLKYPNKKLDNKTLSDEFENNYLRHGGVLTAINDCARNDKIELATYRTYSDWVRGDFLKRGKSEAYLLEVLRAIFKTYSSQVTFNSIADHTSINHPDTVKQYIELLEAMDVIFVQHPIIEDKLLAAPKKSKKIIFKDPFMYHALKTWALPESKNDEHVIPSLVESTIISHYTRFYQCFYIKAEGEVDLAYIHDGKFFPVEIKWRNQIRTKDLKQVSKYTNSIILAPTSGMINNIQVFAIPEYLNDFYVKERLKEISLETGTRELSEEQAKIIHNLKQKYQATPLQ